MRLFELFRLYRRPEATAPQAKQRLQVLIAHERAGGGVPDFLPLLQKELVDVIRKYVEVDHNKVVIDFESGDSVSMLEVNIELPTKLTRRAMV